jgi:hypothetical protein
MRLRAIRGLHGDYGQVRPGDWFDVEERAGLLLEARGVAEMYPPKAVTVKLEKAVVQVTEFTAPARPEIPECNERPTELTDMPAKKRKIRRRRW